MYEKIKGEKVIVETADGISFCGVVGEMVESARGKCICLDGPSLGDVNQKFAIVPLQEIKYVTAINTKGKNEKPAVMRTGEIDE